MAIYRETLKDNNCQYVKSLGNGEHLIYDYEMDKLEVWFNSIRCSGHSMKWNNTDLEFARTYENQELEFDYKLNELVLKKMLPHGSGIDFEWEIEDKGKYFNCKNYYHCMNENGYYDGIAEFQLIVSKRGEIRFDFKLHFIGRQSQYKANHYMLRDYLNDTFYYALAEIEYELKAKGNKDASALSKVI